jgi:4-carboxymuconolactone decarboxylase
MSDDKRERGLKKMREVYGWDIPIVEGDFVELTTDHLFAEIWSRDVLSIRERRFLLIGLLVGYGLDDVIELQLESALRLEEATPEELREIVVFLAHYAGWPRAAKLHAVVEKVLAKADKAE